MVIDNFITALIDKDTSDKVRHYLKHLPAGVIEDKEQRLLFKNLQADDVNVLKVVDESGVNYGDILSSLESEDYQIFTQIDEAGKIKMIIDQFQDWRKQAVCGYIEDFERGVLSGKIPINKAISHLHDKISELPNLDEDDTFVTGLESFISGIYENFETGRTTMIEIPFKHLEADLNGGFRKKDIIILNASTGGGKTMLAQNFVRYWARLGYKVLYVSTEMSREQLIARWVRQEGYESGKVITEDMILKPSRKEDIEIMSNVISNMTEYPISFSMLNKGIEDIEFSMRKRQYDIIVIDHLHQIRNIDDFDHLEKVLDKFNDYAVTKDSLVVLLAQNRKEDTYGQGKKFNPHLGMIRGSTKLIDISSFIGALYEDTEAECYKLKVLKDRHNGIGGREYPLNFIKTGCLYKEVNDER